MYSKTGSTNYVRNYVKTPNPATTAQRAVRNAFSNSAQTYRTLSQAQQNGWISLGAQMSKLDDLGATRVLSGNQAFSALNNTLQNLGLPLLMDPPNRPMPPTPLPEFTLVAERDAGSGSEFSLVVQSDAYTGKIIVKATRAVSPGVNKFKKSAFRQIEVVPGLSAGSTSLTAGYMALYGPPPLGEKIALELTPVSNSGFKGSPTLVYTIVAPLT